MPKKGEGIRQVWTREVAAAWRSSECLIAPFNPNPNGYVSFREGGKTKYIHREVCEIFNGPPPTPEHEAAHSCNARACGNGTHLEWKLHAPNMADQRLHGTIPRGESHGGAKIDAAKVRYIRKSKHTGAFLADVLDVSPALISLIRRKKLWAHIE